MSSTTGASVLTPSTSTGPVSGAKPDDVLPKLPDTSLVFDMTEKALIKAMEDITTEEVLGFVTLLEATQTGQIEVTIFAIFEFQGFDPNAIIRKLLAVNKYFREEKKVATETLQSLKEDVMFMIAANIYMGNLQRKSLSRRSATGRMKIQELISKYSMKTGTTGAGLASDVLTFPRVVNAFPVLSCRMAMVLPSKDFLSGEFGTRHLPKFMRLSAFGSFCEVALEQRTQLFLLHAVCSYSCDQTMVVHEGERKKKKMKKAEDVMLAMDAYNLQWDFIQITSSSPVPKPQMKRAMMTEFNVITLYETLKPIVTKFRTLVGDANPIPEKGQYESDIQGFINSVVPG